MIEPGRVVVVGAGLGGLRTAEALRRNGYAGEVVLVGAEALHPYDRPPLSKSALRDGDSAPYLRPPNAFAELCIDLRLGRSARSLDTERRCVLLDNEEEIRYDAAVLATGAVPRRLPRVRGPEVLTLRTQQDATKVRAAVLEQRRLTVVGAGFLGCEVSATARRLGAEVTLVEASSGPLVGVLGPEMSEEVARLHREHGVDLRMTVTVDAFGDGRLKLSDGSTADTGVLLVAVGAEPDVAWLHGSGVKVDGGVLCDERGLTSAEDVFAVGDAASWWDAEVGRHRRFEHWTNATDQAEVVAANLLAEPRDRRSLAALPYFWSDQYDLKIQALGDPHPADLVDIVRVGANQRPVAVYANGGAVTAVAGIGAPRAVMRSRRRLAERATPAQTLADLKAM